MPRLDTTLIAVLVPVVLAAQAPAPDRVAAWQEDLALFAREFPHKQNDFDKLYPRAKWDDAMRALVSNAATAADADIVLGLLKLVAAARVGHTYVQLPTTGRLASQIFASWNQMGAWLRQVDGLRRAA